MGRVRDRFRRAGGVQTVDSTAQLPDQGDDGERVIVDGDSSVSVYEWSAEYGAWQMVGEGREDGLTPAQRDGLKLACRPGTAATGAYTLPAARTDHGEVTRWHDATRHATHLVGQAEFSSTRPAYVSSSDTVQTDTADGTFFRTSSALPSASDHFSFFGDTGTYTAAMRVSFRTVGDGVFLEHQSGGHGIQVQYSSGYLETVLASGGWVVASVSANVPLESATMYGIAASADGSTLELYLDGSVVGSDGIGTLGAPTGDQSALYLGADGFGGGFLDADWQGVLIDTAAGKVTEAYEWIQGERYRG